MTTKKENESFRKAYGAIHFAADMVEKMSDEHGNLMPATHQQVEDLKRACLEASCLAGAMRATIGGQPE